MIESATWFQRRVPRLLITTLLLTAVSSFTQLGAQSDDTPGAASGGPRLDSEHSDDAQAADDLPPTRNPTPRSTTNDPTQPSPRLREALVPPESTGPRGNPGPPRRPEVPAVVVRARVLVDGKPPLAVLEINKTLYFVREQIELTVPLDKGGSVTLQIESIDQHGVILSAASHGRRWMSQ